MRAATTALLLLLASPAAAYNPLVDHVPARTPTMTIEYIGAQTSPLAPDVREFIAANYDAVIGGHDLSPFTANKPPQFMYVNYYCGYVGNDDYRDAEAWAAARGVPLEDFFLHYAEPTRACYDAECYDLPAGSRVPTYNWYGSAGDLTKGGSRVVYNVGNPNYRAWHLDRIARKFSAFPFYDGVMIDNTTLRDIGQKLPSVVSGGKFAEYPHAAGGDAAKDYGDDLLAMFAEFSAKFGQTKGQLPNISQSGDDPRLYPYVWGVFRETMLQPGTLQWMPGLHKQLAASDAAGVRSLIGNVVFQERHAIASLALYYLIKTPWTYYFPILNYVSDSYGLDPRVNQWFGAVARDIGQPTNDPPTGSQKYFTFAAGISPESATRTTMQATISGGGSSWRLTDSTANWAPEQWRGQTVVFPSGYTKSVYHSGTNWIDLWAPAEVPTPGKYEIGQHAYFVYGRRYSKGLALFRPMSESRKQDATTAATVPLGGMYRQLLHDGTLGPVVESITMQATEGAILIPVETGADTTPPAVPAGLTLTVE